MRAWRLSVVLAAPLLLASCLLTPGRFASTLDIRSDRSFTFTYQGEAILTDPAGEASRNFSQAMAEAGTAEDSGEADSSPAPSAPVTPADETADMIVERKAIAEALAKEDGYRSVEYLGKGKYRIDCALTGRLDRSFIYPFNTDAEAIFPWIAVEVRKDGTARLKAPAFGDAGGGSAMPGSAPSLDQAVAGREGSFTLTTDADLVMHNNEEGAAPGPGTRVVWKVTPTSKTVPTAVVRFRD